MSDVNNLFPNSSNAHLGEVEQFMDEEIGQRIKEKRSELQAARIKACSALNTMADTLSSAEKTLAEIADGISAATNNQGDIGQKQVINAIQMRILLMRAVRTKIENEAEKYGYSC